CSARAAPTSRRASRAKDGRPTKRNSFLRAKPCGVQTFNYANNPHFIMVPQTRTKKTIPAPALTEGIVFLARMLVFSLALFVMLSPLQEGLQQLETAHV